MSVKRLRSVLTSTALLAVTLTGLEAAAALTGGGAVAMAATGSAARPADPPPGDSPTDAAPPDGSAMPSFDPADEPPPPGMTRFVPPPDPEAPDPGAPSEAYPEGPIPDEPAGDAAPEDAPGDAPGDARGAPGDALPAQPALAPAPRPGLGTPVLAPGAKGLKVKKLQVRLQRVGVLDTPVTGIYGRPTTKAVKRFQAQAGFVRSGRVDAATARALWEQGGKVGKRAIAAGENRPYGSELATSCLIGAVVCVDKTARTVRWVVDGRILLTLDARFGGSGTPTREGVFAIYWKSRDHHSRLYDTSMPFAMFFAGGQAVHYSPDFASRGYTGASHGCVNTRQYKKMAKLFDRASVGDRVVVYRSRPITG